MEYKVHFLVCCLLAISLCASAQFVPELDNSVTSIQYTVTETESYYVEDADDPDEIHPLDWVFLESSCESKVVTRWINNSQEEFTHIQFIDSENIYEDWMKPTMFIEIEPEWIRSYSSTGELLSETQNEKSSTSSITDYSAESQSLSFSFPTQQEVLQMQDSGLLVNVYNDRYEILYPQTIVTVYPDDNAVVVKNYDSLNVNTSSHLLKYSVLSTGEVVLDKSVSRILKKLTNGQNAVRINVRYYSDYSFNLSSQKVGNSFAETKIYPNPTSDEFTIETENEIKLIRGYDIQGVEVELNEVFMGKRKAKYAISHLPQGNYFFRVIYRNGNNSLFKLIKQ